MLRSGTWIAWTLHRVACSGSVKLCRPPAVSAKQCDFPGPQSFNTGDGKYWELSSQTWGTACQKTHVFLGIPRTGQENHAPGLRNGRKTSFFRVAVNFFHVRLRLTTPFDAWHLILCHVKWLDWFLCKTVVLTINGSERTFVMKLFDYTVWSPFPSSGSP